MAGSVVSFLLQKLPQLLVDEANYLDGVRKEVDSFQNQLNLINVFLEEYAKKRDKHKIREEFIRQIRDLALGGEYVIDSYIYNELKQRRRNTTERTFYSFIHAKKLHGIRREIEVINSQIEKINNDREKYVIEKNVQDAETEARAVLALHNRRRCVEDIEMVGFVHNSTTLVKQLTEGKLELDVSSILGMGGLGKTTLARKVYNDDRVKNHFDCRAWVYVSQDFRSEELLIEILKSDEMQISESKGELQDLSEVKLKTKLSEYLREKKYLVVMDDVWTTAVWDEVKGAFPDDSNGSRILLTSRDKKVLLHASRGIYPCLLPFLTGDESWELLRKKVFQRQECPPELETLGRQIAESCDGLPLSIVVLAGLLASKEKKELIWEEFHRNLSWHLRQEKEKWEAILLLSYTQLRPQLKPCFLYFGVYPEGSEIPVRQLTQLWIAEGFIQDKEGSSLEDVAENYLWELIDLCLIQVDKMRTSGGPKTCRIHDLLRDLCISESTEEKFLKVSTDDDLSSKERTRRLSILRGTHEYISHLNPFNPSRAHSLLFFGKTCLLKEKHWQWIFKYSKFVRVLNFGSTISHRIPDDIKKLMYLKYLRIESMYLNDIPSSICNLQYLETLDARGSELNCLPDGIWKLGCLRNLYLSGSSQSFRPPPPSETKDTLSELRILSTVTVDPRIMVKLPNLRKLGIGMKSDLQSEEIFESLRHLHHLQTLKITNGSTLPSGANSLPRNITKITLVRVHLKFTKVLGNLPKLRVLKLQHCSSDNLSFAAGSFQWLKVLKLDELSISEWKLGRGAMPHLMHLVINKCTSLTLLPEEELCTMSYLLNVEVSCSTPTAARMLQELQMKMKVGVKVGTDQSSSV